MEPYGGLVKAMSGTGTIGPEHDRKTVGYFLARPRVPDLAIEPDLSRIHGFVSYGMSPYATAYVRILTGSLDVFDDGWFGLVHAYPAITDHVELVDRIAWTNGRLADSIAESVDAWLAERDRVSREAAD